MDLFSDMKLFVAIVGHGSMAAAGREIGLSPASVTARLKALEVQFEAPLLIRSTRSLSLTPEGQTFYESARRVLGEVDDLATSIRSDGKDVHGLLRVTAPFDLGKQFVLPLVNAFLAENPAARVELVLSDQSVNVVTEGFDIAFRYGALADSELVARSLGKNRRVVCASPSYLEQHGTPTTPNDLRDHNCLVMLRDRNPLDRWPFMVDGEAQEVRVSGNRAANDGDLLRSWAIQGHGVCYKSIWDVQGDLDAGRLLPILEDFSAGSTGLSLVFPSTHQESTRVRAFIERAVLYFKEQPNTA